MDRMEVSMVKRTSLAARRALGRTKPAGHRKMALPAWIITSSQARWRVSSERVYTLSSGFRKIKIRALVAPWAM